MPDRASSVPGTLPNPAESAAQCVPPLRGHTGHARGCPSTPPPPVPSVPGTVADRLLALLTAAPQPTEALIARLPDTPGWLVRRTLDELAAAGAVLRGRGRRSGSYVWRRPRPFAPHPLTARGFRGR